MVISFNLVLGQEFGSRLVWRMTEHKFLRGRARMNYTIEIQNPCYFNRTDQALKTQDLILRSLPGICETYLAPLPGKTMNYWQCSSLLKRERKKQLEVNGTKCPADLSPCTHLNHTAEDIKMIGLDYCDEYIRKELDTEFVNHHLQKKRKKRIEPVTTFFVVSTAFIGVATVRYLFIPSGTTTHKDILAYRNSVLDVIKDYQKSMEKIAVNAA